MSCLPTSTHDGTRAAATSGVVGAVETPGNIGGGGSPGGSGSGFCISTGGFGRPPKPMTGEAEALFHLVRKAGADLGQEIGWRASGGVCDGNNIAACGVPVVDTMGVRGGKIHSMEEYLITDSLQERAALSALTIMRLAGEAA